MSLAKVSLGKVSLGKVSLVKVNFVGQLCRSTSDVKFGGEVLQVSPVKVKSYVSRMGVGLVKMSFVSDVHK